MKGLICTSIMLLTLISMLFPGKSFAGAKDTIPPKITLYGSVFDSVPLFSNFVDPGYAVSDNNDPKPDIVISGTFYNAFPGGKNLNNTGNYTIIYTATDSSGNKDSVVRKVKVYYNIPPDIQLVGAYSESICQYSVYNDKGYSVTYLFPANLKIDTLGTFYSTGSSSAVPYKTYTITYEAIDTVNGNAAGSATRWITVLPSGSYPCNSSIGSGSDPGMDLKIYPNPASEIINIDPQNQDITNISIINTLGKVVYKQNQPEKGILQISISYFKSGIYTVIVDSKNGVVTRQVVKN